MDEPRSSATPLPGEHRDACISSIRRRALALSRSRKSRTHTRPPRSQSGNWSATRRMRRNKRGYQRIEDAKGRRPTRSGCDCRSQLPTKSPPARADAIAAIAAIRPVPAATNSPKGQAISFDDRGHSAAPVDTSPAVTRRHLPCGKRHPCRHLPRGKCHRKRRGDRSRHNIPSRMEDRGHIRKADHSRQYPPVAPYNRPGRR